MTSRRPLALAAVAAAAALAPAAAAQAPAAHAAVRPRRATRPSSSSPSPARATRPRGAVDLAASPCPGAGRAGFDATADAAGAHRRTASASRTTQLLARGRGPPRARVVTANDRTRIDAGRAAGVPVRGRAAHVHALGRLLARPLRRRAARSRSRPTAGRSPPASRCTSSSRRAARPSRPSRAGGLSADLRRPRGARSACRASSRPAPTGWSSARRSARRRASPRGARAASSSAAAASAAAARGAMAAPAKARPAASLAARRRRARSGVSAPSRSRHFHEPLAVPGMFMRASEPSPSTSWVCTIASSAPRGERELDQPPVRVLAGADLRVDLARAGRRAATGTSRSSVSWSWVPV